VIERGEKIPPTSEEGNKYKNHSLNASLPPIHVRGVVHGFRMKDIVESPERTAWH